MGLIERRAPTRWNDLDFSGWDTQNNPFNALNTWLAPLNITADQALIWFTIDYEEALTEYAEDLIDNIIQMVAVTNAGKYDKLLAAYTAQYNPLDEYNITDGYTDTRTPNLTQSTNGGATVGTTVQNKQTRTDTENPGNYASTTIGYKDPYDGTGFHQETKSESSATGSRSTSVSYTGQPDESNTTSTNNSTTTNTGTETIVHTGSNSGRKTSPQQLLDEQLALAERMNIFKIIERDLAAKLFIAVWPSF